MKLFSLLALLCCSIIATAQIDSVAKTDVRNATIEYNGGKYPGYIIEYAANPDLVEAAIKEELKAQNAKPKSSKGFLVYRNVILSQIDRSKMVDAFISIERKSRKEDNQSVVSMILTNPGEISDEKKKNSDASAAATFIPNGNLFLNGLQGGVNLKQYEQKLSAQEESVKKSEKKLADLKDDQSSLEKKIAKMQKELEDNKKEQEAKAAALDAEKKALDALRAKKGI